MTDQPGVEVCSACKFKVRLTIAAAASNDFKDPSAVFVNLCQLYSGTIRHEPIT